MFVFTNNFFFFLIAGFSKKFTLLFYFFIIYYNILYVEEIVNLVTINYLLNFNNIFKLSSLNFLEFIFSFLYIDINYYWFIISVYIVYRFFLRSLSFYGASTRRESFFIYQNWFKNYKDRSSRELQVNSRITALTTKEFNDLFKRYSYLEYVEEEGDDPEPRLVYHKPYYKDTYKAVYYYFLQQNEIKLLKNANDIRRLSYYKDRYGPNVFSYLISKEDDKMAKLSSSKISTENLSESESNAKSHI